MNYKIEDIVRHPIQLTSVQLIELNLKKFIFEQESTEITREIDISTNAETISENLGYADVTLSVVARMNDDVDYYNLSIKYRGICINEGEELKENEFAYFLEVQALKLIWPYFREILPGLMMKMGVQCFDIPTIDVLETIKNNRG